MIASFDAYELAQERGQRRRREAAAERLAHTRRGKTEAPTIAQAALERDYSSSSTRCATANAEFAAGTPQ